MNFSDLVNMIIQKAIDRFDGTFELEPFEELLTIGELIDRLSIVNFKLYTLKDEVTRREDDKDFCAWAAKHDVFLCSQRSKIKNCIDMKLLAMLSHDCVHEPETKIYGDSS